MRNSGRRRPRLMRSSRTARDLGALSAHALDCEQHLGANLAPPRTTSSEIEVALRSRHTRTDRAVENKPHDRLLGQRAGIPGVPVSLHPAPPRLACLAHREPTARERADATRRVLGAARNAPRSARRRQATQLVSPHRHALPPPRFAIGDVQPARGTSISIGPIRAGRRPLGSAATSGRSRRAIAGLGFAGTRAGRALRARRGRTLRLNARPKRAPRSRRIKALFMICSFAADGLYILAVGYPFLVVAMALFVVWLTGRLNAREDRRRAQRTVPGE